MVPPHDEHPTRFPASLTALVRLAMLPASAVSIAQIAEACAIVREVLAADDAYIMRAGEPHFVRIGSDADPTTYEIKQKGYYLSWRELASKPELVGIGARVVDRIVVESMPLAVGARPTHIASLLPAYEGTSEALVVRGTWPGGLSSDDITFLTIARPLIASLVSSLLDAERQERQRRQLALFAEVAGAFSEARRMDTVLTAIATAVAKASGFDFVSIVLFDAAVERAIEHAHNLNRYSDSAASGSYWKLEGAEQAWLYDARHMERTGRPLLWPDVFAEGENSPSGHFPSDGILRRYRDALLRFWELAHILSVGVMPIRFQDRILGSMFFSSTRRHQFDPQETALLGALVAQAAASIGGLQLHHELREANARLAHLATHDVLTGLPNRALFHDRLNQALGPCGQAAPRGTVALLSVDLDHFKVVNDTLGHAAGDQLLIAVADRLTAALRPADTVARFGGDEFAILLGDDTSEVAAQRVARRLVDTLRSPFTILEREVVIGASIGVALGSAGAITPDELLREADIALYQAKGAGRGQAALFSRSTDDRIRERITLEADLRRALAAGEFEIHYQPQVDLSSGRIAAVEALVRWDHPCRGLLAPSHFIPLAEETGLIVPLGAWVLERSCRDLRDWLGETPELAPLQLSVNLSPRQLTDPTLVPTVARILEQTGLEPNLLCLELTEGTAMDMSLVVQTALHNLRGLGVRMALDDFGTGHSSLGRLHQIPVSTIKVDRSFVASLGEDATAPAVIRAMTSLAHALDMQVTAEGVETAAQMEQVRMLGCDWAQGYHLDRPMTAESLAARLRDERTARSAA